jgi:NTP pyrophosphatase (non-canonical NTP hydrolase)
MDFRAYQLKALSTAVYPNIGENAVYPAFGLANEAGEVLGKLKKSMRDGWSDDATAEAIRDELGDVLWYIAVLAAEYQLDLNDIAQRNVDKLTDRKSRGVLKGSGDNR